MSGYLRASGGGDLIKAKDLRKSPREHRPRIHKLLEKEDLWWSGEAGNPQAVFWTYENQDSADRRRGQRGTAAEKKEEDNEILPGGEVSWLSFHLGEDLNEEEPENQGRVAQRKTARLDQKTTTRSCHLILPATEWGVEVQLEAPHPG